MTALSPAPDLSPEELQIVTTFDAAEEPEEVTVARVAWAIYEANNALRHITWEHAPEAVREHMRRLATAALAALRGDRAPLAGQHTTDEEGQR